MRAGLVIVVMISLAVSRMTGGDVSVSHDELNQSLSSRVKSKEEKTADHKNKFMAKKALYI